MALCWSSLNLLFSFISVFNWLCKQSISFVNFTIFSSKKLFFVSILFNWFSTSFVVFSMFLFWLSLTSEFFWISSWVNFVSDSISFWKFFIFSSHEILNSPISSSLVLISFSRFTRSFFWSSLNSVFCLISLIIVVFVLSKSLCKVFAVFSYNWLIFSISFNFSFISVAKPVWSFFWSSLNSLFCLTSLSINVLVSSNCLFKVFAFSSKIFLIFSISFNLLITSFSKFVWILLKSSLNSIFCLISLLILAFVPSNSFFKFLVFSSK